MTALDRSLSRDVASTRIGVWTRGSEGGVIQCANRQAAGNYSEANSSLPASFNNQNNTLGYAFNFIIFHAMK